MSTVTVARSQNVPRNSVDDPDTYAVIASLLPNEWIVRAAKATNLVVQEETVTNWGCMPSGPPMEAEWKPVLEGFRLANAETHTFSADHAIGLPYQLVSASTIATSLDRPIPNLVSDGWQSFWQRYPKSGGYLQLSAVGFDALRRRAMVYVAHHCGGLCGGGMHHLFERDGAIWREVDPAGLRQCRWIS
ncbi:MAG: hypothetical protein U0163_00125 [Gemmatimonadaceae bacterium]